MPAAKKQKTATATATPTVAATVSYGSPAAQSPAANSPAPERKLNRLASRVVDNRPLPCLPEPQPLSLSNNDYQTIAASAVLATSLEQSRLRWVSSGIFERYWVKPESGKNAKPAPANNPDVKWMKSRGECRIRIEPHLFVADMYVEERAKAPSAAPKQPIQQYRPPQPYGQQHSQQYQSRALPPVMSPGPSHKSHVLQRPQPSGPRVPHATSASSPEPQAQKPDPVISMLATRASSNPELKALMKEVATGNATPDQLKVFQKHIDELTTIISKQKQDEEESTAKAYQQAETIQYDGPADVEPTPTAEAAVPQAPKPQPYPAAQHTAPQYGQQSSWSTPPPLSTSQPVIVAFKDVGATEDRFLFPQNSILEALSPQHLLVSFIVTRKGRHAVDTTGLEPGTEYWQPITIMIEVAYGREELLNCIRRWVKPADEVRKHMEEVMQHCQRVPEHYLALRLPFRSTIAHDDDLSKEATPMLEDRIRSKPAVKVARKGATNAKSDGDVTKRQGEKLPVQENVLKSEVVSQAPSTPTTTQSATPLPVSDGPADAATGNRTRRTTRKSVRISEG